MAASGKAFSLFICILLVAGCAPRAHRSPTETPPGPQVIPPVEASKRPPTREEIEEARGLTDSGVTGFPTGGVLPGGLPGADVRVNQDPTGRAQNETAISANPNDPLHLVAAWNDYSGDTVSAIGYGWTRDGGASWQSSLLQSTMLAPTTGTGDPSVAFDGAGNVYLGILATGGVIDSGILVATSTDGGETFGEPVRVADGGDKPYLTADPVSNAIYMFWAGPGFSLGFTTTFSRSTDGGATFSTPVSVSDFLNTGNNIGAAPAVGPNGEIYVAWSDLVTKIEFDRSLDGGSTWVNPDIVIVNDRVACDEPLNGGFRNPVIPALAVDRSNGPHRGRVYVAWCDQRLGDPDVMISYSDNLGTTWSAPGRVNDDAQGNGADQFFPWLTVDDAGAVHVSFLDRRDDPDNLLYAAYLATSTDGAQSFGPNVRVASGRFGPSDFGFLGDYTGVVAAGDSIYPVWPDAREGDEDIYARRVSRTDYDQDGVLNDGDGDGVYAGNRCTGGQTAGCDDNCPGLSNADQVETDGDLVGDACDNCPSVLNVDQADADRDGLGDACDPCPNDAVNDPDGDLLCATAPDNCPLVANALQTDSDADGAGDACDPCPGEGQPNDDDGDGACPAADTCDDVYNPGQTDADGDGLGDVCDICPTAFDAGQQDADGDGRGDACDCQSVDFQDFPPFPVEHVRVFKTGPGDVQISWYAGLRRTDAFSIRRGLLSQLGPGSYGSCLVEGLDDRGAEDTDVPPAGDGYFYVVQEQNFDCGLGSLGFGSGGEERTDGGPGACIGHPFSDLYASSETTVYGSVTGSLNDLLASDDVHEAVTEEVTAGDVARLEQRWTFQVTPASRFELHFEAFHTDPQTASETMLFEMSTNGTDFTWVGHVLQNDVDSDEAVPLPSDLNGTVIIRLVDSDRSPMPGQTGDTVEIDELFIRQIP